MSPAPAALEEQARASSLPSRLTRDGYPIFHLAKGHEAVMRVVSDSGSSTRSPSPASDGSNLFAPPSSRTSSWAGSIRPSDDCGSPGDSDTGGSRGRWDEIAPSERAISPVQNPSREPRDVMPEAVAQQNHLHETGPGHMECADRVCLDDRDSESSETEAEYMEDDDEEEEEDNGWSGQNGNLEATVIAAVDGDLGLAAFLIPLLHKDFKSAVKNKVESWQHSTPAGPESSSPAGKSAGGGGSTGGSEQSARNPRKRRRRFSSEGGDRGGDDDDGEDNEDRKKSPEGHPGPSDDGIQQPMLACPFHKFDALKYGIQHGGATGHAKKHNYRSCAGPGFKSIQRLKEHLKRVHSPVQCGRCFVIFSGADRAACISKLAEHLQSDDRCVKGDPSKKEGISDAQWASLEKQNRKTLKNQEAHRVEKWFEIWGILFETPPPKTPWYDEIMVNHSPSSPSKEGETFAHLFLKILDHKVQQGDINFSERYYQDIRERLKGVIQQTFKTYVNLHGALPRSEVTSLTGGSGDKRSSVTAGSGTTQPSLPASSASNQLTSTTSLSGVSDQPPPTAAAPAAYPMHTFSMSTNMPSPNASPYSQLGMSMSRQPSQYHPAQGYMPAALPPAPAAFPPTSEDASGFYYMSNMNVFQNHPAQWPANVSFQAIAPAPSFNLNGPEFYSQPQQTFGQSPADGA